MSLVSQINALASRIATEINKRGVPVGGSTNYVLAKKSATSFDTQWVAPGTVPAPTVASYVLAGNITGTFYADNIGKHAHVNFELTCPQAIGPGGVLASGAPAPSVNRKFAANLCTSAGNVYGVCTMYIRTDGFLVFVTGFTQSGTFDTIPANSIVIGNLAYTAA